jgi:capsular exopolysaccharide synthesis family protein
MSRVYSALEKAEREKQPKEAREPSLKILEEKMLLKKEGPPLRTPEERVVEWKLPPKEEGPILIAAPNSFAAEQFRKLRTEMFLRLPNSPHLIMVTSTVPQEGKTLVSVNLAIAISEEIHKNSILIDGDLRKPSIYSETYPNSKGLTNYLSGGASLSEILIDSGKENLRFIMGGPPTKKPSELIGSKKMEELLTSLREFEDNTYLIIDTPPIMVSSEPTLLSKMVDGIILVVMAGRTPRESIRRAAKLIDPQKIIGVVLNQIDFKPTSAYSKYYYHYYDYYKK